MSINKLINSLIVNKNLNYAITNVVLNHYYIKHDPGEISYYRSLYHNETNIDLFRTDNLHVKLVNWRNQSKTDLHNHDKFCSFLILRGRLLDKRYKKHTMEKCFICDPGEVYNIDKDIYHQVYNIDKESLSLHIYFDQTTHELSNESNNYLIG